MPRVLALLSLVLGTGCISAGDFPCSADPQCVSSGEPGTCQPTGFCSYPDVTCTSGQRYGSYAGAGLASTCTGPQTAAGCGGPGVLTDDFNDGVRAPAWQRAFQATSAMYAETGGQLVITTQPGASGSNYAGYLTAATYDLRDDRTFVEVVQVPDVSGNADTYLQASIDMGHDVALLEEHGTLVCQETVNGTVSMVMMVPYDPVQHRWWQLREAAGTLYWETSPDSVTWTTLASKPDPIDVSAIYLQLVSGTYLAEPLTGTAIFDNFDGGGTPSEAICPIGDLGDNFDAATVSGEWDSSDSDATCTAAQSGGQAVFTLSPSAGYCDFNSTSVYNLTGSSVAVKIVEMVNTATQADQFIQVRLSSSTNLEIGQINGFIHFDKKVSGTFTSVVPDVPYDPVQHAWWRIREMAGSVFWETSPDGATWTTQAQVPDPFDISAVTFRMGAGTDSATANPGVAKFDDLGMPP